MEMKNNELDLLESMNNKLVSANNLKAGDVILCYKGKKINFVGDKIRKATDSNYTHAAIYLGSNKVAESVFPKGVTIVGIIKLVGRYDHVAIFRPHEGCWSEKRVSDMKFFINKLRAKKVKYNLLGLIKFQKKKEKHALTLIDQLGEYFNYPIFSPQKESGSYFCSELVVACFTYSGIIGSSAAILYKSDTISPGDLSRDPTFGIFYGYISHKSDYQIPETDEFLNESTYNEIMQS